MHEEVIWTYLSATEIAHRLADMGTPVCPDTVRDLLTEYGFHKRQAEKTKTMAETPHRNEQEPRMGLSPFSVGDWEVWETAVLEKFG